MEIRHLRYFLAVARHRNFTRAAGHLGIAPPTLTRQIQDLEADLGTQLFIRAQRDVQLTDAGMAFMDGAAQVLQQLDTARLSAQCAARGDSGHFTLGYVASAVFSGFLQDRIAGFRKAHPDIGIDLREHGMPGLPAQVEQGKLDLAYIRAPMALPPSVAAIDFAHEPFTVAIPGASWLCDLETLQAHHLQQETFILPEQVSGTLEMAQAGKFTPILGRRPGGLVAVIAAVSMEEGISVVPASVVDRVVLQNVVFRNVSDCQPVSRLSLLYRRFEKAPAVRRFIDHAIAHSIP